MKEWVLEIAKTLVPVAILFFQLQKTRTELDILYAKQRGCDKTKMRKRWYHKVCRTKKTI